MWHWTLDPAIILPTEGVASFHNSHIIISPSFPNETFDCNSIEM